METQRSFSDADLASRHQRNKLTLMIRRKRATKRERERGVPCFHSSPREGGKCRMQEQRDD